MTFPRSSGSEPWSTIIPALVAKPETAEHKEYGAKTEFWTPLLQTIGLAVCALWCLGGLAFLARQLAVEAYGPRAPEQLWPLLVILAQILTLAAFITGVTRIALRGRSAPSWQKHPLEYLEYVEVFAGALWIEEWACALWLIETEWQAYAFAAWMISQIPAALLAQRLAREIQNPLYPTPPIASLVAQMAAGPLAAPETRVIKRPVPMYRNGRLVNAEEMEDWEEGEEEEEVPQAEIDVLFRDAMEFAIMALRRGLSRDGSWCPPDTPRVRLTSGNRVTKNYWNTLIGKLMEWMLVEATPAGWAFCPGITQATIEQLCRVAEDATGAEAPFLSMGRRPAQATPLTD